MTKITFLSELNLHLTKQGKVQNTIQGNCIFQTVYLTFCEVQQDVGSAV